MHCTDSLFTFTLPSAFDLLVNVGNSVMESAVCLSSLEVWPGFSTSILQFETNTMLIADVSHKILHFQTALDAMYDVYNACRGAPNFKELVAKKIIGQIVLTRYLDTWLLSSYVSK